MHAGTLPAWVNLPNILLGASAAIALIALFLAYVGAATQTAQPGYEQYKWQDTKYAGIRSKIVTVKIKNATSTAEYIKTGNQAIDSVVAGAIDQYVAEFTGELAYFSWPSSFAPEQNISYQIIRSTPEILSVSLATSQRISPTKSTTDTAYWTFNPHTGQIITLEDLFSEQARDGTARTLLYIKQAIAKRLQQKNQPVDLSIADKNLPESELVNFLAADQSTLRFDFAAGEIMKPELGPQTITLSIDNLQLFMQTDTARTVFTVMPVGEQRITRKIEGQQSTDCKKTKCIALTFDDGPSMYTTELLDTLGQAKAHATFFIIGQNIAGREKTILREYQEGHTIGNHTWSHPWLTRLSLDTITNELMQTNEKIKTITGNTPTYMRPPNGAIGKNVYTALERTSMTGVMWSVDTRDWSDRNSNIIYNRVVAEAKPGSIIILHDAISTSVKAVPRILDTLQKQGYTFVSIDELFGPNVAPGKIISRSE